MIRLIVESVKQPPDPKIRVVILKEERGERYFLIWTGWGEGTSIDLKLRPQTTTQPLTYEYFEQFLRQGNLGVEYALIHTMTNNIYYARIVAAKRGFLSGGSPIEIDCRPTDAILMALYFAAPIYIANDLLDREGITKEALEKLMKPPPEKPFDAYADFWENFVIDE